MEAEIQHLLDIRAIEQVPVDQRGCGFYSILFLVPKSSGGQRAILNLKDLNLHVKYQKFKMQSLQSILACIRQEDFLTSIDLKEAYIHLPIWLLHRRFLRFSYAGGHWQYRALSFSLSSAPRTFTKILDVMAAHLQVQPIRLQCYLDDILIQSSSMVQAHSDLQLTIQTLQAHGFSINWEKCQLSLATSITHLEAVINTLRSEVFLSQDHRDSIRNLVSQVRALRRVPLLLLSQLLGKMISCLAIIPWAHCHTRALQWLLLPSQRSGRYNTGNRIRVPTRILQSLDWRMLGALEKGCLFREPARWIVTSDANLFRWGGGHLEAQVAQG